MSAQTRSGKMYRSRQPRCRTVANVNGTEQCAGFPELTDFIINSEGQKCCPPERLETKQDFADLIDYLATLTMADPDLDVDNRQLALFLYGNIVIGDEEDGKLEIRGLSPREIKETEISELPQYSITYNPEQDVFSMEKHSALYMLGGKRVDDPINDLQITEDQLLEFFDYAFEEEYINGVLLDTSIFQIAYGQDNDYVGRFEDYSDQTTRDLGQFQH